MLRCRWSGKTDGSGNAGFRSISAACGGTAAQAQQQQALEEIIVTATKREVSMQDVPIAVTAFTEEDIVRQGFKKLDDYVGQIPGLAFSRREPGGTTVST